MSRGQWSPRGRRDARPTSPQRAGQVGALLDLYFAVTSQSGTWSVEEMQGWIKDAGLLVQPPVMLLCGPWRGEVIGTKTT